MVGKTMYGPYDATQGGLNNIVADPAVPSATAVSGGAHPVWPTTEYATVVDGGITWTAILARVVQGAVYKVLNPATFQHQLTNYPDHYFQYGTLVWLTGANAGYSSPIRDSLGVVNGSIPYVMLTEMGPNPIEIGDTYELTVGCSKTRFSCQSFNNIDNHRAFPDMPTEDRALSTPNISNQGYAPKATK
jgi:hypothetical protein